MTCFAMKGMSTLPDEEYRLANAVEQQLLEGVPLDAQMHAALGHVWRAGGLMQPQVGSPLWGTRSWLHIRLRLGRRRTSRYAPFPVAI
jgi:hypothetical protein